MRNRAIVLTGKDPQETTQRPASGEAWVHRKRAVDQADHGADVLAEASQHERGVGQHAWLVIPRLECPPRKIGCRARICPWLFSPPVIDQVRMANRRPPKCQPVMRITCDCLLQQSQSRQNPLSRNWKEDGK